MAVDHPITITPHPKRVRVRVGGEVVAETTRALALKEASHPVVLYVPREDARMDLFRRTQRRSHCPYKGDASYFTIAAGGAQESDVAWSYESPFPGVSGIAGHLAFYPNKAAIEDVPET